MRAQDIKVGDVLTHKRSKWSGGLRAEVLETGVETGWNRIKGTRVRIDLRQGEVADRVVANRELTGPWDEYIRDVQVGEIWTAYNQAERRARDQARAEIDEEHSRIMDLLGLSGFGTTLGSGYQSPNRELEMERADAFLRLDDAGREEVAERVANYRRIRAEYEERKAQAEKVRDEALAEIEGGEDV
jgi:hypothetical protein